MFRLYRYYQNSYFRSYKVAIRTYLPIGRAINRQTFFILRSFLYTWLR